MVNILFKDPFNNWVYLIVRSKCRYYNYTKQELREKNSNFLISLNLNGILSYKPHSNFFFMRLQHATPKNTYANIIVKKPPNKKKKKHNCIYI